MKAGLSWEKLQALHQFKTSPLFSTKERVALELAERMTITSKDASDQYFRKLQKYFNDEELVELAAIVAFENFRSKFNHFFRVEAQGFCQVPPKAGIAGDGAQDGTLP